MKDRNSEMKAKIGFSSDTDSTITTIVITVMINTISIVKRKDLTWQVFLVISFFALSSSESGCTGRIHSDDDHHYHEVVGNDGDGDDEFGSGY